ncbi:unnamed protein product [Ceutorhynchus assimilis]|uniref:HORMA domain-containing protein n=1 Tax=Ceutorhynchus assimilis TaxID=467358 RepID=A0A9P0DDU8_9CUCU|nr:unnamed protein product [Ceutorhynchus assimilis]
MNTSIEFPSVIINNLEVQNSIKTFELSKKYLKRITKLALLNIINRRIQVPENEFIEKLAFDQVPYFIFKRKSQNRFIKAHHKYGTGVLDALEKGFLRQMDLIIVRKNTKEILESYRFKYKYNNENEGEAGIRDSEKVRKAMLGLLNAIRCLPGEKWPEDDVDLLCDICYQDNTPSTYEPPHFRPNTEVKSVDHFAVYHMGRINTGFHKLTGEARGWNLETFKDTATSAPVPVVEEQVPRDEEERQYANDAEQEPMEIAQEPLEMAQGSMEKQQTVTEEERESLEIDAISPEIRFGNLKIRSNNKRGCIDQIMKSPPKKAKLMLNESIENKSLEIASVLSQALENCACEWRNLDQTFQLINCNKCLEPVHAVCNGYFDSQAIDKEQFICLSCSSNNKNNKLRAHLRLVLYGAFCEEREPAVLRNAKKTEKKLLLKKLEKYGIIQPGTGVVNLKALEEAIRRNFFDVQNSARL